MTQKNIASGFSVILKVCFGAATVIGNIAKWMNMVAAALIFLMMVLTSADAIIRYLSPYVIPGATNINEFLMVGVVFLALAYTQSKGEHVRVELLLSVLGERTKAAVNTLALLLSLGMVSLITWQGWNMANDAWLVKQYTHGTPHLPMYPWKFLVPLGGLILCLQLLVDSSREVCRALGFDHALLRSGSR